MQHIEAVRVSHRFGHRAHQRGGAPRLERAIPAQCEGEAFSAHQAHAEEVHLVDRTDLVHGHDVRMLHAGGVLGLAQEARDELA